MTPFMLASVVLLFVMTLRLADVLLGGHYVCPSCGARSQRRHSRDCPWSGPSSG
jgi:hypothetical protein